MPTPPPEMWLEVTAMQSGFSTASGVTIEVQLAGQADSPPTFHNLVFGANAPALTDVWKAFAEARKERHRIEVLVGVPPATPKNVALVGYRIRTAVSTPR